MMIKKIQFLDSKREALFIYFPVILLFFSALELILRFNFWSYERSFWLDFLTDVIFLNVVHNIFTYIIIFCSSSFKSWMQEYGARKFWIRLILILAVTTVLNYLMFIKVMPGPGLLLLSLLFFNVLPSHHAISQSLGISLIYSKISQFELKKIDIFEKRILYVFLWLIIIAIGLAAHFKNPLHGAVLSLITLSFLCLIYLWFFYQKLPIELRGKKRLFYLRLLHWPLSFFSLVSFFSTKAVHGFEYYFVTEKILKNSNAILWKKWAVFALVAVVGLTTLRIHYFRSTSDQTPHTLLTMLTAFSVALTLSHYYLDRLIYTMRHDLNRQTAGKLLSTNET